MDNYWDLISQTRSQRPDLSLIHSDLDLLDIIYSPEALLLIPSVKYLHRSSALTDAAGRNTTSSEAEHIVFFSSMISLWKLPSFFSIRRRGSFSAISTLWSSLSQISLTIPFTLSKSSRIPPSVPSLKPQLIAYGMSWQHPDLGCWGWNGRLKKPASFAIQHLFRMNMKLVNTVEGIILCRVKINDNHVEINLRSVKYHQRIYGKPDSLFTGNTISVLVCRGAKLFIRQQRCPVLVSSIPRIRSSAHGTAWTLMAHHLLAFSGEVG